ncbi:hypothetical protein FNV43_RR16346 [Rhamnella rubrinervis]|uniref:MORF/ORRM1/DAG-like MORF domain-containing protein n=1 Tax=Rhamnella rubrinervis TaxID=2594499 RepID=A0A8K0MCR5_9ROSA|nr:hypothetical protein FNV43_RR16346 [Rhamnella rubrinervis]
MATNLVHRSLSRTLVWASLLTRNISTSASLSNAPTRLSISLINRLPPLVGAIYVRRVAPARSFSTNTTSSSLREPDPNWSSKPPKETILLDGCDREHWLVVMEPPQGEPTRDEIIDSYIKTLASVVGSEEEARMKIYTVSTRCYYAFGALVPEELSEKIKDLPRVRWVLPDSYLDVKNKDYGGEPFINGQAVPYHPKYHEEWIRNRQKVNEKNRRNDRPRNADRSRSRN